MWDLSERTLKPGPTASANAAAVRTVATDCPEDWRGRIDAVALYLEGRPRSEVLACVGGSMATFRQTLRMFRLLGPKGLRPGADPMAARLRAKADGADGIEAFRLRVMAAHIDGGEDAAIAESMGRPLAFVRACIRTWLAAGRVSAELDAALATLTPAEVDDLRGMFRLRVDPDEPTAPLTIEVVRRICRVRFGLPMTLSATKAMCHWRGLRFDAPAAVLSRSGSVARVFSDMFRDVDEDG